MAIIKCITPLKDFSNFEVASSSTFFPFSVFCNPCGQFSFYMVAHPPTYTYSAHCTNTFVTVCNQETCDDGRTRFHELHSVHYIFQASKRLNFTKTPSWVKIFRKLFCLTSSFVCVTSVKSILSLKQLRISGALPLH